MPIVKNGLIQRGWMILALLFGVTMSAAADDEYWQQQETRSADGTKIAYYTAGFENSGLTPLLVISGGPGSDHRYMRVGGVFKTLSQSRPVVMFDQRGTSQSGTVTGTPRLVSWAEDVEAVRAAVGAEQLHILGHSFGGIVAMAYAEEHADRLASVIFSNSTTTTIAATKSLLADLYPDQIDIWRDVRANLTPRFKAREIDVFTSTEFVDLERLYTFLAAIADYDYNIEVNNALRLDMADLDFSESARGYRFPVLVLHGRYDPVISAGTAWELHKMIPGSEIVLMPATGHLPFAERPQAFAGHVADFLARVDGGR